MPTGSDYTPAVVIINQHEPEGEASARLLEIAQEKNLDPRVVEAVRGEHDAGLSFRVPQDVVDTFNADRADRWPDKIENDDEKATDQVSAGVDGDAYAADQARTAQEAAAANAVAADNQNTTPADTTSTGKAKGK